MVKRHKLDERRSLLLPGGHNATIRFAVEHWIQCAQNAIKDHGFFTVALSGGSTPKKIFQLLSTEYKDALDWNKVFLFWSDERSVLPSDPESNYHMAMTEGGLSTLPIDKGHIFRMVAESDMEKNAKSYSKLIQKHVKNESFDLIMLGMGDDGHTASLFPNTEALNVKGKLVTPNHVCQKDTWRMTFTFELINKARNICIYVLGANKAEILASVLLSPLQKEKYPSGNVGTKDHPACWIIDDDASKNLLADLVVD